jgi:ubiquinone/menaquinone biosynthesis C-methylase UbiE
MGGVERIPWIYDLYMAVLERTGFARWRAWLVRGASGRILEIGAGTGRDLPLYPSGARVIAIEPHPETLARARRRAPSVPLVRARAEALPFREGVFETVVSGLVLCSVDDPAASLAEIRRVLAPRGTLRMIEHVRSLGRIAGRWQDLVQPAWTWFTGGCRPNRDTERALEEAGFRIDPSSRRVRGTLRRLEARPASTTAPPG